MSKINLNYGPIQSNCLPALDNAATYLSEAVNALQQASIPGDFYKKSTLQNTISNLKDYKSTIQNVKGWIYDSNKNYDSMIDKLENQANKLPVYIVGKRNQIIN